MRHDYTNRANSEGAIAHDSVTQKNKNDYHYGAETDTKYNITDATYHHRACQPKLV